MFDLESVRSVQLEVTNTCNAACPQCPRNYFGGRTIPTLPLVTWTWREFRRIASQLPLKTLEQVYFCGTYGDPMMHRQIADMVEWLRDANPDLQIGIHTNGGAGSATTWQRLARCTDFVAFGIDGLADTNHVYRRGVRWKRVERNAQTYVAAGGTAYWDFIAFRHNQHQVQAARELSASWGFKRFSVKRTGRFLNRAHEYSPDLAVLDRDGSIDYWIHEPTLPELVNPEYQRIEFVRDRGRLAATDIHCNAVKISEIYIGADGFVFPCGWLHDRMYGPEIDDHRDHVKLLTLMDQIGGKRRVNVFHTPLEHIVDWWFPVIQNSWSNNERLDRCAVMCGNDINIIGAQNQEINYKA